MGFAGTSGGRFFFNPGYVDPKKAPGESPVAFDPQWWRAYVTGGFLYDSPNMVWLAITVAVYFLFPYTDALAHGWSLAFLGQRVALNSALVLAFFGFWHVTLYGLGWAKRPFMANRKYRFSKLVHNVVYSLVGAFIWSLFEVAMIQVYHLGRVPYIADAEVFASWRNAVAVFAWVALSPINRDLHFYHAHVFIHLKAVFRHVHSLHHRNTDIEPFSGLCMHPVEHLYYWSCAVIPLMMFPTSPFAMLWVGQHALLAPAASHSGWEDHWQSDLFHAIHHMFANCNFGVSNVPWDGWMGTARFSVGRDGKEQAGRADAKATLGAPDARASLYMALTVATFGAFAYAAVYGTAFPRAAAFLITFGSAVTAFALQLLSPRAPGESLASHLLFPHEHSLPKLAYYIGSSAVLVFWPLWFLATQLVQ